MFAARRDHLQQGRRARVGAGSTVLVRPLHRCHLRIPRGRPRVRLGVLTQLERWVQGDRQPDLTLWFDVEPGEAAARRSAARQPDRLERMDQAFFERVQAGYARRHAEHPQRIVRIDARGSMPTVWAQVEREVSRRGWW